MNNVTLERTPLIRFIVAAMFVFAALISTSPAIASDNQSREMQRAAQVRVVHDFFELMHRKEIDAWANLWASNGRIIVPYPPSGFGTSIDGQEAILTAFRGLFANFETFDYQLTAVYPSANSEAICVEYTVRATIAGGTEYTNQNIAVFRFEGGLISAYHDYFDPRRFQIVIDALAKK